MERLGIMGGTFDPVHVAHLVAAAEARAQLNLDRVFLVVAGDPWQKHESVLASADARYEMLTAALEGIEGLEPSRIEIDRAGPTYTIDTVNELRAPDRELFLIVGRDVAQALDTWKAVDELQSAVTLAIVDREGVHTDPPDGWRAVPVTMPRLDVSSTDLRRRVATGEPVDFLMPAGAVRVLRARGLYTST
jgi:nicotinate-nucleotide adenylyltransferase